MATVEILSIIKDIFLAGAAGTTAYVAYTGLEKWKKELRGKANFEVARELIKSVYRLRDELRYCRSPFVSAGEFPEGYRGAQGRTAEEEGQAWAHVYTKRWEPVGEAIQSFDAAVLEAEALWGAAIKDKAKDLSYCVRTLQVDIEEFISDKFLEKYDQNDREFMQKIKAVVFETKSEDNELTIKINAAIEGLESEIRPHLSRD